MKKAILCFFIATLFLFSCKKEHSGGTNPAQKTYNINFTISGFTQTIANSTTSHLQVNSLKTDSVSVVANYLDLLYYYVFDANGNLVHSLNRDSTDTNFDNISDNLPSGTYTMVIAAGKSGLYSSYQTFSNTLNQWYMSYDGTWKDTFFDKFQLTVSSGNINQNVVLNRVVGQLDVNILDTIPNNAASIGITVNPEDYYYRYYNETPFNGGGGSLTTTTILPSTVKGTANNNIYQIIGNTLTPFTVTIVCYDGSQNVLGTAIVDSVSCQQNKRTILSGKLFGSNNAFNITLNPWNPNPITIPFSSSGGNKKTN